MEKAILNIDTINVTQGMNGTFSHKGDLAIDLGSACSFLKAPFTGVIKRIYANCNAVWLESCDKVKYADGTEDYMTIVTFHDNDISNLKVGQIIKQGTIYYQPGIKGKATGPHIHISAGKGKFSGTGWHQNEYGVWVINNNYDITKALFLHKDVKIKNKMYEWLVSDYSGEIVEKYLNLNPDVSSWTIYKTNKYYMPLLKSDVLAKLNPKKFGGLSYKIEQDMGNYHFKITTSMFGTGYIAGNPNKYSCSITDKPLF